MMIEERIQKLLPATLKSVIGDLPGSTENNVCIMLYDGPGNTEFFGGQDCQTLYNPLVQIVVRHKSYEQGKEWLTQVQYTLHRYHDMYFRSIILVGTPQYLGRSMQKLHEFQILFDVRVM